MTAVLQQHQLHLQAHQQQQQQASAKTIDSHGSVNTLQHYNQQ
jgi:hypothetical protein